MVSSVTDTGGANAVAQVIQRQNEQVEVQKQQQAQDAARQEQRRVEEVERQQASQANQNERLGSNVNLSI